MHVARYEPFAGQELRARPGVAVEEAEGPPERESAGIRELNALGQGAREEGAREARSG